MNRDSRTDLSIHWEELGLLAEMVDYDAAVEIQKKRKVIAKRLKPWRKYEPIFHV